MYAMVGKSPLAGTPVELASLWATRFTALAACLYVTFVQPSLGSEDLGIETHSRSGLAWARSSTMLTSSRLP